MSSKASKTEDKLDEEVTTKSRNKWPVSRFLKTVTYFNGLPFQRRISRIFKNKANSSPLIKPHTVLFRAGGAGIDKGVNPYGLEFGALDDVVMGGVSESIVDITVDSAGVWEGVVSEANNGGFAGIRTKTLDPALNLSSCRGIVLRVKSDVKRRLKFIARDDPSWNGVAWSYSFECGAGTVQEIKIPLGELRPTQYAKTLVNAPKFDASQLTALQLTLSKFEYDGQLNPSFKPGPFTVTVTEIRTF